MNENQLTIVKEYEFIKPLFQKVNSIFDDCFRDCHKKYFHTIEYKRVYDIKLTNTGNIEKINLTICDINMGLYELNKKLKNARQKGFIFNQINKFTIKLYCILPNINIQYYLKFQFRMCHRRFLKIITQNPDYVKNHCNDQNNPFHFGIRKCIMVSNVLI